MKKKKLLFFVMLSVCCVTFSLFAVKGAAAPSLRPSEDIFLPSNNVTVTADSAVDVRYVVDHRKGLGLSSSVSGAKIAFKDDISGPFELDFRAYTARETNGETVKNPLYTPSYDLQAMSLIFTDKDTSESFTLRVDGSSDISSLPQASVTARGKTAGIYRLAKWQWNAYKPGQNYNYETYNTAFGETKLANADGNYSYLLDSTFSNAVWHEDSFVTAGNSTRVGFDPASMQIYGYSRGQKIVVWDLSQQYNDERDLGFTMKSFARYNVTLEFSKITSGKTANLILYSLSGQSLAGTELIDGAAPALYADSGLAGVKNRKMALHTPYAYDVCGRTIPSDFVRVTVTAPGGSPVSVQGLGANNTFAAGCNFTPAAPGSYRVEYAAADANGHAARLAKEIFVFDEAPATEFCFEKLPADQTVGKGTQLRVPAPYAVKNATENVGAVTAELFYGDASVRKESPATAFNYTFDKAGVYRVEYWAENASDTFRYTVNVRNDLPAFSFAGEIAGKIKLGETVELPVVTAKMNDAEASCVLSVVFPDGTRYRCNRITATQLGVYAAEYTVTLGKVRYKTAVNFTAVIGTQELFLNVASSTIVGGGLGSYSDAFSGLAVTTKGPGIIRYNKPINFAGAGRNDVFIELTAMPSTRGLEYKKLHIKLTDVNDSTNVVTIEIRNDLDMDNMSDVKAGYTGQQLKGLRGATVMTQDSWGTMVNHSFVRRAGSVRLSFDYATKNIYANNTRVIGLADPKHFSREFTGFTADSAYLSVETVEVSAATASYVITNVDGTDLTESTAADTAAPQLSVNTGDYTADAMPRGIVGKAYPVFTASAYDVSDGAMTPQVNAYYVCNNVRVDTQIENGTFTPRRSGVYELRYTATDTSGNAAVKTLPVSVSAERADVTVTLAETEAETSAGKTYKLPDASVSGGVGNVKTVITVTGNGLDEELTENFVPQKSGVYKINYVASDFLGQTDEASLTLTVTTNAKPVLSEVDLPSFVPMGEAVVFPDFEALDYSGQTAVSAEKTIKVVYNGKTVELDADRSFTPEAISENDAPIEVQYIGRNANGQTQTVTYRLKAVKLQQEKGKYYAANYFVTEGAEAKEQNSLTYGTDRSGAKLTFVRSVAANDMLIEFSVPAGYGATDKLVVRFYDSEDSSVYFDVNIYRVPDASYSILQIAGDDNKKEIAGSFDGKSPFSFRLAYVNAEKMLKSADPVTGADSDAGVVKKTGDGKTFHGFSGNLLRFEILFGEVRRESRVTVTKICNQTFGGTLVTGGIVKDTIAPIVNLVGEVPMVLTKGDTLIVPKAVASDVLSAVTITLTVTAPNGDKLINLAVPGEARSLEVTHYGYYKLSYVAKDAAGLIKRSEHFVYSVCNEPLTITLNGSVPAETSTGSELTLPSFTAESSYFDVSDIRTYIYLISEYGTVTVVRGQKAVIMQKGKFTVRYYAVDPDYNTAYRDFTVTVK